MTIGLAPVLGQCIFPNYLSSEQEGKGVRLALGPEPHSVGHPQKDPVTGVTWAWRPTGASVDCGGL